MFYKKFEVKNQIKKSNKNMLKKNTLQKYV